MSVAHQLNTLGKPAWIGLSVLAFLAWWPLGLAAVAYGIGTGKLGPGWSGRMWGGRAWGGAGGPGRWYNLAEGGEGRLAGGRCGGFAWHRSSGNRAFDEYRDETLKRLEDEQREFHAFLDRLRRARDKAEFDQFMEERRGRPQQQAPEQPVVEG
jgi:hypothetical protein